MKKWVISYIDPEGTAKTKDVQAVDVYIALMLSAIAYSWITSIREVR